MSWFNQMFGRLASAVQALGTPAAFRTTFLGQDVEYVQHDMRSPRDPKHMTVEDMWATQPHLRTVVDFRARNIAQLGMQLFESDGEERKRVRGSDVSKVLKRPNPYMTGYDLLYDLVATRSLYDTAYWVVLQGDAGMEIHPFSPAWVTPMADTLVGPRTYRLQMPGTETHVDLPADKVVEFRGWTPIPSLSTASPVETLRMTLEEQFASRKHRLQLWRKNGRVGSYIHRPKDAPSWDNTARKRFMDMYRAFTGNDGEKAGGVPMLEDGMEIKRVGFTSADEQWAESVRLSLETVAQVYQLNPVVVGSSEGASYNTVRELHRAIYRTMLGADIRQIEERVTAFVLPMLGAGEDEFVKLNVESMLRGSFEEQASVLSTSVGAPWMTRDEARALQDMPALDDEQGSGVVTPLNVLIGGQASPQDGETGGGGGGQLGMTSDEFAQRANAVGILFRAGFDPAAALEAAGLPPIDHTGGESVSVRGTDTSEPEE